MHTCESPIIFCSLRAHRKSMAWRCIYNLAITKRGCHAIFDTPSFLYIWYIVVKLTHSPSYSFQIFSELALLIKPRFLTTPSLQAGGTQNSAEQTLSAEEFPASPSVVLLVRHGDRTFLGITLFAQCSKRRRALQRRGCAYPVCGYLRAGHPLGYPRRWLSCTSSFQAMRGCLGGVRRRWCLVPAHPRRR